MCKYKSGKTEVEAIRWSGSNADAIVAMCAPRNPGEAWRVPMVMAGQPVPIDGGATTAEIGQWILRAADGGIAVMDEAKFKADFKPAD